MTKYNFVSNNGLVELVERGLRKGYWDKALIPELKKRFKELEKKEKLLELYKELAAVKDSIISYCEVIEEYRDDKYYGRAGMETKLEKQIKELENDK